MIKVSEDAAARQQWTTAQVPAGRDMQQAAAIQAFHPY